MLFDPLAIILTAVGFYMLIKLRFFFVIHPVKTLKKIGKGLKKDGSFASLSLALAGTLGIGNIFGVALGLIIGGAGSVFWMLVSTLFASVIKYSEIVISNDNDPKNSFKIGSIFESLGKNFGKIGCFFAFVYASACLSLSLSMGAGLQIGAVSESVTDLFDTPPIIVGIIGAILILISVIGGIERIEKITSFAIPMTTIIYILIALSVIFVNRNNIPSAIRLVFDGAFSYRGTVGGIFGFFSSRAVREGYSRGILSNEAGAGTSSMAHSRSISSTPSELGLMGIVEVFFDTVILCSLTSLMILTSDVDFASYDKGMPLVFDSVVGSLGDFAGYMLLLCVVFFAYSTVVCWYYYGQRCSSFLFSINGKRLFAPVYILFLILSPLVGNYILVAATDVFILILTFITLFVIIKKSDRILVLSDIGKSSRNILKKSYYGDRLNT